MALDDRPVTSAILYAEDGTAVAVSGSGSIMTAGGSSGSLEVREAYLTSSSTATSVARSSLWNDPGSAGQRGVVSSNSNDSSGGTGARTVRITYYPGDGTGPLTEDVTMNGTTAVSTTATDIRFVESVEVLTVGSNGAPVGDIDVTQNTNGTGTVLSRMNTGENRTYYAQHWIPSGTTMNLTAIYLGSLAASQSGTPGRVLGRRQASLTANSAVVDVIFTPRTAPDLPTVTVPYDPPLQLAGPQMFNLWIRADSNTNTEWFVGFSFYDS